MRGIGDRLSAPLMLPKLPAVLANPGVRLATKDVFAAFATSPSWPGLSRPSTSFQSMSKKVVDARHKAGHDAESLVSHLAADRNDLEPAAISLCPPIAGVLAALRESPGCELARMSGSGATCFGLFGSIRAANAAARALRAEHPSWWVRATALGG
jgi:4-diphosphocytidyl-2-C-methyl-D-erythritol kinase